MIRINGENLYKTLHKMKLMYDKIKEQGWKGREIKTTISSSGRRNDKRLIGIGTIMGK